MPMRKTPGAMALLGLTLVLGLLAVDAVLVFVSLRNINLNNHLVLESQRTINLLESVLSQVKDAESSQRGYLLTGESDYLRFYHDARSRLGRELEELGRSTEPGGIQHRLATELVPLCERKLAELQLTIELRQANNEADALSVVREGRGLDLMREIRRDVAAFRIAEERRMSTRIEVSQAEIRKTFFLFSLTTAAALLMFVLASYLQRRDFLVRERASKAIRKSESWLSTTLLSLADAVLSTDAQGNIRYLNPVAQRLTGWTQEEAVGRASSEVFRAIDRTTRLPIPNPVERVIKEGVTVDFARHGLLLGKGGVETPIDDSAAPILAPDGGVMGVVLVFRDVSEANRLELEREQALVAEREMRAIAERANRAKDHFLAVLSHELRTPLNPILLCVTSMLERSTTPEDLRPNFELIRRNVNLQARLIDDLLDVMRVVAGKMPLHLDLADCHQLIHQAVLVCQSELLGKEVHLELALDAPCRVVRVDSGRFQQVLWNLIKNAVKFTPTGGSIMIRTSNRDGRILIDVADTGIGIESDRIGRIFDPFEQGDGSITRRFGGMGLGLAISKGIIERHQGELRVESPGKDLGTTFTIEIESFPVGILKVEDEAARHGVSEDSGRPANHTILLVEDDRATSWLLARILRDLGHTVKAANSIDQALEVERSSTFDLIISDIGLPDGSGLELMRAVVARRGPVPSIALSGYGMEEDVLRSREAGFAAHMTKPIDFFKLKSMIELVTRMDLEP